MCTDSSVYSVLHNECVLTCIQCIHREDYIGRIITVHMSVHVIHVSVYSVYSVQYREDDHSVYMSVHASVYSV